MSVQNHGPSLDFSERIHPRDLLRSRNHNDGRRSRLIIEQSQQHDDSGRTERLLEHMSIPSRTMSQDDSEVDLLSAATDRLPALTRSSSIDSSSSVDTHPATGVARYMLDVENGISVLPQVDRNEFHHDLLCPFQILDCNETFSDIRDFKTHVFSHFRGHPTLPTFAPCFLCNERFRQTAEDDSALAWNLMLSHMVHHHFRRGEDRGTIRADFDLMRWMYDRKIIDDQNFKRTQDCPQPVIFPSSSSTNVSPIEDDTIPPLAPTPPRSEAGQSSRISEHFIPDSLSTGYHGQAYVTFAGPRAERRRRDSLRPAFQRYGRTVG